MNCQHNLVADLRSKGADVWVDLANITSNDFLDRINEGLKGRDWCVVVLTPNAIDSSWVKKEVHAAFVLHHQGAMKGIIPILAEHVDAGQIPPIWAILHRYDATSDYPNALHGLMGAIGLSDGSAVEVKASAADAIMVPRDASETSNVEAGTQEQGNTITCRYCRSENRLHATYCNSCGAQLPSTTLTPATPVYAARAAPTMAASVVVAPHKVDFGRLVAGQRGTQAITVSGMGGVSVRGQINALSPWVQVDRNGFDGKSTVITIAAETSAIAQPGAQRSDLHIICDQQQLFVPVTVEVAPAPSPAKPISTPPPRHRRGWW